jgi:hypothetical protein
MKEMQKKSKMIQNIQDRTQAPTSNEAIRMANTNFHPQSSKVRSIKGFGEIISQLSIYVNVSHLDISLFHIISQEVLSHFKVFHYFVKD